MGSLGDLGSLGRSRGGPGVFKGGLEGSLLPFFSIVFHLEVFYSTTLGFKHHMKVQLANLHLVKFANSFVDH